MWEHPDADLGLWAAHPGLPIARPDDLDAELGIEAFDVTEQESGTYRIEVRRTSSDRVATVHGRLFVVWNEGRADEQVEIAEMDFGPNAPTRAWTIDGRTLAEALTPPPPPAPNGTRGVR